jgi:3-hydroxymyristoyl/3-hydroxydecanoyl-(acyl carrier protein) dehydratase
MTMQKSIAAALITKPAPALDWNGVVVLDFRFAASDLVFAGHFPNRPLVPGAFQLEMVRAAAEVILQRPFVVTEIARAKFLRPIAPDETVRMELKLSKKESGLEARAGFSVYGQAAGEAVLWLRERE